MKDKLIKSTLILLVGGCITKILGMIIKIVIGRMVGSTVLGLYMMILPTFSLFIGLSQFGFPVSLSRLVAEDKRNNKNLFFSVFVVLLLINLFLVVVIIIISPFLANNLLKNNDLYYGILAIGIVIPFISISSICRSYFFGKERMLPHIISNIIEDLVRLICIVLFTPFFIKKGVSYLVCFLVLINVISESVSALVLILFLPKKIEIKRSDLFLNKKYIKDSLTTCIPTTTGRLVGSIGYFLEPILLNNTLLSVGYTIPFITREYGILSGYVMPILLLPSFFTGSISQALLPNISKDYANNRIDSAKRKLKLGICLSISIGLFFTCLFTVFPSIFLKLIYHTNEGINYMKFLAPICLLQYLQAPLSSCLDAIGKSSDVMIANIIGSITRSILLVAFSLLKIGIWGLIFAISINVLLVTIYDIYKVKKAFSK
ncbi:MAG: oligosaccharide flippase family protein [Bacilli bacterium]|nr:oligosaccharide flippase family protein [Bacilli bacterium]